MRPRSTLSALGGFFEVFGSALAASRAVEANRQPRAGDLRMLGIEKLKAPAPHRQLDEAR